METEQELQDWYEKDKKIKNEEGLRYLLSFLSENFKTKLNPMN